MEQVMKKIVINISILLAVTTLFATSGMFAMEQKLIENKTKQDQYSLENPLFSLEKALKNALDDNEAVVAKALKFIKKLLAEKDMVDVGSPLLKKDDNDNCILHRFFVSANNIFNKKRAKIEQGLKEKIGKKEQTWSKQEREDYYKNFNAELSKFQLDFNVKFFKATDLILSSPILSKSALDDLLLRKNANDLRPTGMLSVQLLKAIIIGYLRKNDSQSAFTHLYIAVSDGNFGAVREALKIFPNIGNHKGDLLFTLAFEKMNEMLGSGLFQNKYLDNNYLNFMIEFAENSDNKNIADSISDKTKHGKYIRNLVNEKFLKDVKTTQIAAQVRSTIKKGNFALAQQLLEKHPSAINAVTRSDEKTLLDTTLAVSQNKNDAYAKKLLEYIVKNWSNEMYIPFMKKNDKSKMVLANDATIAANRIRFYTKLGEFEKAKQLLKNYPEALWTKTLLNKESLLDTANDYSKKQKENGASTTDVDEFIKFLNENGIGEEFFKDAATTKTFAQIRSAISDGQFEKAKKELKELFEKTKPITIINEITSQSEGDTLLHTAMKRLETYSGKMGDASEFIDILLNHGILPQIKNKENKTAIDYLKENKTAIDYLKENNKNNYEKLIEKTSEKEEKTKKSNGKISEKKNKNSKKVTNTVDELDTDNDANDHDNDKGIEEMAFGEEEPITSKKS